MLAKSCQVLLENGRKVDIKSNPGDPKKKISGDEKENIFKKKAFIVVANVFGPSGLH